jgi:hypothetical protein
VDAIFMDSNGVFDTVSVANKLPRGLAARRVQAQKDGTAGNRAGENEKMEHITKEEM